MPIIVTLDGMLSRRKMRSKELAAIIGITEQNRSLQKSGQVRGLRFDTPHKICEALDCQPAGLPMFQARQAGQGDLDPRIEGMLP